MDTLYSQTLNANADSWNGYTLVMRYATAALSMPGGTIARMRVTFEAGSTEAITITNAYVGHKAATGDAYDFATTPVQLLFSGGASTTVTAGTSTTSDWATFAYDQTTELLVAFYTNGGAGSDMVRYRASLSNITNYFRVATNEAGTVNKTTGYTSVANQALSINLIEVELAGSATHKLTLLGVG